MNAMQEAVSIRQSLESFGMTDIPFEAVILSQRFIQDLTEQLDDNDESAKVVADFLDFMAGRPLKHAFAIALAANKLCMQEPYEKLAAVALCRLILTLSDSQAPKL